MLLVHSHIRYCTLHCIDGLSVGKVTGDWILVKLRVMGLSCAGMGKRGGAIGSRVVFCGFAKYGMEERRGRWVSIAS
jgi:hypothetical protein